MKKIAAAYIRVSTHMQEELSPDAQLRCIRVWGDAHGYYVPDEYVFIDNGISGRKAKKRHDFLRMIGLAKTKPASPFEAILFGNLIVLHETKKKALFINLCYAKNAMLM